jgi:hypothetical protein
VQWHRLSPQTPEECRYRYQPEGDAEGETAICGLVRAALPAADDRTCRVTRAACVTCCRADPPTPTSWNSVVASLVYRATIAVGKEPNVRREVLAQAADARTRALARLDSFYTESVHKQKQSSTFNQLRELIPPPATSRPERILKWSVGVTTTPRRRPTLERCLDALTRAGWRNPHLFMDSVVRIPERFGRLPGTLRGPDAGAWPNHYLGLFELTLRQPDANAFMILQDDALLYDGENMRVYLEEVLWPGGRPSIVSLYCPGPYTAKEFGWHRYGKAWVWGALAFIFPRETAQMYLRDRRVCRHRWRSAGSGLSQIDVLIGRWARRRGIPVWYPTPSLVQHIGETSTLPWDCPAAGPRAASLFLAAKGTVVRSVEVPSSLGKPDVLG